MLDRCPKGNLRALPTPSEIEEWVCRVASQKQIEDRATDEVCALIKRESPHNPINEFCHATVEEAWDKIVAQCPKANLKSLPMPGNITKLVCSVATQQLIEDMATYKVCSLVQDKFPNKTIIPYCRTFVEKVWNNTKAKCRKGDYPLPTRKEIILSGCYVATQKQVKETAIDDVCAFIKKEFPQNSMNEFCPILADRAWDQMLDRCPKGNLKALPTPSDIEEWVCRVATQKQIEDRATDEVCALIKRESPHNPINEFCHAMVEEAWDKIVAQCPKANLKSRALPGNITKLVCSVATQQLILDMATLKACSAVQEKFPNKTITPYCRTLMEEALGNIQAKCRKGDYPFPTRQEIIQSVCDVATQKQVKETAIDDVCAFIKKEFPENSMNEFCPVMADRAWDEMLDRCPKGNLKALPTLSEIEEWVCRVATQKQIEDRATDEVCALIKRESPHNPINEFS